MRRILQRPDLVIDPPHRRLAIVRLMLLQLVADALHVCSGRRRPTDNPLIPKHLLESRVHLGLFDKLAPIRIGLAF